MSEELRTRQVTVVNPQGLHARPAHRFVETASRFNAKITIMKDGAQVDGKSILELLTLGASQGTELSINASGQDAEAALCALASLVEQGFAEDDAQSTSS